MFKKIAKISAIVLGSLVGLVALLVGLVFLILTPARLTPIVNDVAERYLEAKVSFDTVDLTLVEDFPMVSVRLKNAVVVSHALQGEADSVRRHMGPEYDTLVRFEELLVSGNLLDIVTGNFAIRRVRLTAPVINAYVAENGRANWEIYKSDTTDTVVVEDQAPVRFDVSRVTLRRTARLRFCSRADSVQADVSFRRFSVRGRFTEQLDLCDLKRLTLSDLVVNAQVGGDLDGVIGEGTRVRMCVDTLGIRQVDSLGRRNWDLDLRSNYSVASGGVKYCDSLPLNIRGGFGLDTTVNADRSVSAIPTAKGLGVLLRGMTVQLDQMRLAASGRVAVVGDTVLDSDLSVSLDSLSWGRMVELLPAGVLARDVEQQIKNIKTNIVTSMDVAVRGSYDMRGGGLIPSVRLDVRSNDGQLSYGKYAQKLDRFSLNAGLYYTPGRGDSTGVVVRKLELQGAGISLGVNGAVWNALVDPHCTGTVKGEVDLDVLGVMFPGAMAAAGVEAHGVLGMDVKADVRMSQMNLAKIGEADLRARITMDDVKFAMAQDSLYAAIFGGRITVGANENKRDSLMDIGARVLRAAIRVDSAYVTYKGMVADVSGVKFRVRNAASSLSTADRRVVHPLTGKFEGKRIYLRDVDSAFVRVVDGKGSFSILPSVEDNHVPLMKLHLESKTVLLRDGADRIRISRANIDLGASLSVSERAREARRMARLDSLQRIYPEVERDSLTRHARRVRLAARGPKVKDDFADSDLDMKLEGKVAKMFRRWRLTAAVKADRIRLVSPYFPLRNVLRKVDLDFNNKEFNIRNTVIRSGSSEFKVTGCVSNIQKALTARGTLKVNMDFKSDTLNVNELVQAANAGVVYGDMVAANTHGSFNVDDDDQLQQMLESSIVGDNQSTLIVIPANLEADLGFTVNYGIYANLGIDSLSGRVRVRDRVAELKDIYTKTDAGEISLTAIYATRSKNDIMAGFDLQMREMKVERLIELIPSIDSITPMLRSFEGLVNCQIAATSAVDTAMNLILPSLSAAVRISGENLVLLDGETFTEISKMLMFKNKKRNIVEKISVEMLVRDNKIEMFPFVMQIDRYKAAISGVHYLDMNFKYHISVLQSPLPFRVGVNVFGNLDDFDFKIGRALYKSDAIPVELALVDTVRVNLREQIADISSRGIRAASMGSLSAVADVQVPKDSLPRFDMQELSAADSLAISAAGITP